MTSIYEAFTIKSVLKCHETNKGYLKIWYLYILSTVQLLQVVNASLNLPIYWCVGTTFKAALTKYLLMCKVNFNSNHGRSRRPSTMPLDPPKPTVAPEIGVTVNTQLSPNLGDDT